MIQSILRIVWGILAVAIYLTLVMLLVFYFNHRSKDEKKHYVKKDEHRIQVGIAPAKPSSTPVPKQKKPKKQTKKHPKKIKPKVHKKSEKKVLKEKVVKKHVKKRDRNVTKPKKRPKDLFANVTADRKKRKPLIKVTDKPIKSKPNKKLFEMIDAPHPSKKQSESLKKQKQYDSGIENSYLAKVQEMLEGWPAQSDFAGEKVKVHLKIDPTGHFEFVIKRKSRNPAFNRALTEYLKQLQEFGFGPHKGSRTYLFEAEFIAKD